MKPAFTQSIKETISLIAHTITVSLAMVIPVLFIGSFSVMLNSFPVQAYQNFLDSYLGGAFRSIIQTIQTATVGTLAIYITIALNLCYTNETNSREGLVFKCGSLLSCLTGFCILVGLFAGKPDLSLLSGQGVFSAMVAGIAGSILFSKFESRFQKRKMLFVDGVDSEFSAALHVILPYLCATLCFAVANYLITVLFNVESLQHLFMKAVDAIFMRMHRSYSSGLLFTTLTSLMWWFGIHGNNVLNQIAEDMFAAIIPGEIVSKSFIDTFVNMGGTGCTIGLLLAMMAFGKRSSTKKLTGMALLPSIFNIGELMVFGFPIIYNPSMIIPFILSPVLCFSNAFLLTKAGILPPVTNSVVWTTPALMSGYIATGSARGILVQLLNILISAACYAPFVIMYEKRSLVDFSSEMKSLVEILKDSNERSEAVVLTECEGDMGRLAKLLAMDLDSALASVSSDINLSQFTGENPVKTEYKLQYDDSGQCVGARAHVSWTHSRYGAIYPPLVLQIAKESGDLYDLETFILESAVRDSEGYRKRFGEKFRMSVGVTVSTLRDKRFVPFLQKTADLYRLRSGNICLEVTEQEELLAEEETAELTNRVRVYGYDLRKAPQRLL